MAQIHAHSMFTDCFCSETEEAESRVHETDGGCM